MPTPIFPGQIILIRRSDVSLNQSASTSAGLLIPSVECRCDGAVELGDPVSEPGGAAEDPKVASLELERLVNVGDDAAEQRFAGGTGASRR